MPVRINSNGKVEIAFLDRFKKGVGGVQNRAINETLFGTRKDLQGEMRKTFDNPTPFTLRSMIVEKTGGGKNFGKIRVQPKQAEYLLRNIHGGARTPYNEWIIIPADGTRRNQYGNLTRAARRKLFSDRKNRFVQYSPTQAAIIRRQGGRDKTIAILRKRTRYLPRFDFYGAARKSALRRFPIEWRKAQARFENRIR